MQKTVDCVDPHDEEGKRNKTAVKLKQVQYICPIFRFEKQTLYRGRFVLISLLFYFFFSLPAVGISLPFFALYPSNLVNTIFYLVF